MNIFKEMVLSVYSYKSYKEFLNNRRTKVFGFGVMLMLIYFLITMGIPFLWFNGAGGIAAEMDENIPEFELEDGNLWVEDVIRYEEAGSYVEIDTDPEWVFQSAYELRDFLYDYTNVIIIDSEKMIVKSDGQTNEIYFSDLDFEFSKDDLMGWVPYIYIGIAIFMIFAYIWMTALFFFGVLFVALMGMIAASCMNCKLTFGQLYLLGIYSRTLPLIIKAAVSFLPIDIPFFFIINFGLSLFIIIMALQRMKEQQLQKPLEFTSQAPDPGENNMGNRNENDFSWMK